MAVPSIVPKVGLQLLLEPQTSSVAFRAACGVVGALYPAYATCKLVESKAPLQSAVTRKWLKYWVIYGGLSVLENSTDKLLAWFPYYHHAKFAFLMWLQLYQTQAGRTGADYLYQKYVQPGLRRYQGKIDLCIEHLYTLLGAVYAVYRVPIQTGLAMATEAARQAQDFVAWFTSDDGSSQQPPAATPPATPPALGPFTEASSSSIASSGSKPHAS